MERRREFVVEEGKKGRKEERKGREGLFSEPGRFGEKTRNIILRTEYVWKILNIKYGKITNKQSTKRRKYYKTAKI